MKLCGFFNWCKIGWLIVFVNLLILPHLSYSQNLAPIYNQGVTSQHAVVGSSFSYNFSNAFTVENNGSLVYEITDSPSWLNGTTSSVNGTPDITDIGSHTVFVRVSNSSDPALFREVSFSVTVHPAGATYAAFTMNTNRGCGFQTVYFYNKSQNATSFEWDFDNGNTSSLENPSAIFDNDRTYTIRLTINSGASTSSQTVTIFPIPEPEIGGTYSNDCEPLSATLQANGDAGVYYYWDFSQQHASQYTTAPTINLSNLQNGLYDIRLETTDANGCKGTKFENDLFEVYETPVASFSFLKANSCEPSLTTFTNNSNIENGTISSSNWTINGIPQVSHESIISYNFVSPGSFNVSLETTTNMGCVSEIVSDNVTFNSGNTANFIVDPLYCLNETLDINAETSPVADSFQWEINGSTESTNSNLNYDLNNPGSQNIVLTATFSDGCVRDVPKSISVEEVNADFDYSVNYICGIGYDVTFQDKSFINIVGKNISRTDWFSVVGGVQNPLSSLATFTHRFVSPGTYNIRLVVESEDGCQSIVNKTIQLIQPTVSIEVSGLTYGCIGDDTYYTATYNSPYDTANSYSWDFGDGNTGTGASTLNNYVSTGIFDVLVEVTSNTGCIVSTTKDDAVAVSSPPVISLFEPQDNPTCFSSGVDLEAEFNFADTLIYNTPSETFTIDIPSGNTSHGFNYYPFNVGIYNIELTAYNNGCASSTETVNLEALNPKALFSASQTTFCEGGDHDVNFSNASNYTAGKTVFEWNFGDGSPISTELSPDHTYSSTGDYTVSLTVTDTSNFCSHSFEQEIHIYSYTPGGVNLITADEVEDCAPFTVNRFHETLTDQLSSNYNVSGYLWDFNNDGVFDDTTSVGNVIYTYENPGTYSVKLKVTSSSGCNYEVTQANLIRATGPIVNFSLASSPVCIDEQFTFDNLTTHPQGTPTNYIWDFGDGTPTSTIEDASHTYTSTGSYTVTLDAIDDDGCSSSMIKEDYIAIVSTSPEFNISSDLVCSNDAVNFENTSSGDIAKYLWDFDNDGSVDLETTSSNDVSFAYPSAGEYYPSLTTEATNGCEKTYSTAINIIDATANFTENDSYNFVASSVEIGCADRFSTGFTPLADDSDVVSYFWDFGNGNTSTERSPRNFYTLPGSYTVSLEIEFNGGCIKKTSKENYIIAAGAFGVLNYDSTPACSPNNVLFSISEMSSVQYISLDYGNGNVLEDTVAIGTSSFEVSQNYTNPGGYGETTPALTLADDACGAYSYENLLGSIYTSALPSAIFSTEYPSMCQGVPLQFIDESTSPDTRYNEISSWRWFFGNSANDSTHVNEPAYAYVNQGIYSPTLIVSNELGCSDTVTNPNSIQIYGNDFLNASFTIDDTLACPLQDINFESTATTSIHSPITTWTWNFGEAYASGEKVSHAFNDTYKGQLVPVTHIVTDDKFCTDSTTRTVEIDNLQAAFDYVPQPVYRGSLVDFTDVSTYTTGTTIENWSWNFENATPAGSNSPAPLAIEFTNIIDGNTASLELSNNNGCTDETTIAFDVLNNPPSASTFYVTVIISSEYLFKGIDFDNNSNPEKDHFYTNDPGFGQSLENIRIVSLPDDGILTFNGSFVYAGQEIPYNQISLLRFSPANIGSTSFEWEGFDGIDWSNSNANVYIDVKAEPGPPDLDNLEFNVTEDSIVTITRDNFINKITSDFGSSIQFDSLRISVVDNPGAGQLFFNGSAVSGPMLILDSEINNSDAVFTFVPAFAFNGTVSFSWNAHDGYKSATNPAYVIINYANTPPELTNIERYGLAQGETQTIDKSEFLSHYNDPDVNDLPVWFYLTNLPDNTGTFADQAGNPIGENVPTDFSELSSVHFRPNPSFEGRVDVTWMISDGDDTGSAQIIFEYVNDPPIVHSFELSAKEDVAYEFSANDFDSALEDIDPSDKVESVEIVALPLHGSLFLDGSPASEGQLISRDNISMLYYLTNFDWNGIDTLYYNASDGTDWAANDSIIIINAAPVNDSPRPNPDAWTIDEDVILVGVSVAENDDDVDDNNSILNYYVEEGDGATAGENGSILLQNNGDLTFIPNQDVNETLYFIYTVCDDDNACAKDTVTIYINPINDAPTAISDIFDFDEDEINPTDNCLSNDYDIDNDLIQLLSIENLVATSIETLFGTLSWNADGNISISLNEALDSLEGGESIQASFNYVIGDIPSYVTDTSFFTIKINGLNDPPITFDDNYKTDEGVSNIQSGANYPTFLFNDHDPEGDTFTAFEVNGSSSNSVVNEYGTFNWSSDGNWEFLQNTSLTNSLKQGETLDVQYSYTAIDKYYLTESNPALITFHIAGVNDTPVAQNDTLKIDEDDVQINVSIGDIEALLRNDTDVDGDNFKVVKVADNVSGNVNSAVGLLRWSSNGEYSYEPKQDTVNHLGAKDQIEDVFTYYINDDFGATTSAQLVIIISGVNDNPFAIDDALTIYEDTLRTKVDSVNGLLSNDGDADRDPIIVAVNNSGTHTLLGKYGVFTWEQNGAFTYDTDSVLVDTLYYGEEVVDKFTYTIKDPSGLTDNADLFITIIGQNDAPYANDHFESMQEDDWTLIINSRSEGILAEDYDIDDNNEFGIIQVINQSSKPTAGKFGSLDWNYDGTFIYTLNPEMDSISSTETFRDSFLYIVEDRFDSTDQAYLIIDISGDNDNPEAQVDILTLSEDTIYYYAEVSLLNNDRDTDGDFIKQSSFNNEVISPINTTYASFDWDSTGYFTYNRHVFNNILNGLDTLAYDDVVYDTIPYSITDNYKFASEAYLSLIIQGKNDPPVANQDNNLISENTPSISSTPTKYLLYNDYEIDRRDSLMLYSVNNEFDYSTEAKYGTLIWDDKGFYKYNLNFEATDTLYYREQVFELIPYSIIDLQDAIVTDTLKITIIGANDKPIAVNDTVDIMEDERSTTIFADSQGVLTNDIDVDGDTIVVLNPNGEAIDSISGTFGVLIIQANGQAEYVLNIETDSLSANELVEDYFTYTINDGRTDALGEIIIRIKGENDLPIAFDDFVSIIEDTDSIIAAVSNENALLYNDFDVDGDTINVISVNDSINILAEGNYGELQWNPSGAYVYVTDKIKADRLAEGDTVNEHFTYIISDTNLGKDTALISIEIIGVNDPPVALFDSYSTFDVEPVVRASSDSTDILDNDYDVDGDSNHITQIDQSDSAMVIGVWGIFNWQPDGSFTYQPDSAKAIALRPNEYKSEIFKYTIEDDLAASDTSSIYFNIVGINNEPIAINDSIFILEDILEYKLEQRIIFNDIDPDLDTLVVTEIENDTSGSVEGFYGTIIWNDNGEITFISDTLRMNQIGPSQTKTESYTYTIIDEGKLRSTAELVVKIIGENDPIIANDDYVTLREDTTVLVDVLANDIDPDNNYEGNLAKTPVTVMVQPSNGTATVNSANGFIFYVPFKNYSGLDSLQYRVCDDENSCSTAWVYFDITPINDPPLATHLNLITPLNTPISFNAFNQVNDVDDGINPASLSLPSYPDLQQSGESIIYTPPVDSTGRVEFVYSLADYIGQRAYVVVTVIIQDDGYGAQNDTVSTNENIAIIIEILENDTLNGFVADPLSLDILSSPKNGIASYSPFDHHITYQPFDNFNGIDSLKYIVGSSAGTWDFAAVYIKVEPINSPIIVSDDDITTIIDHPIDIPILNNDFDADNGIDSLSVRIKNYPQFGSVVYNPNTGLVNYIPETEFRGYDTFTYEVCDLDTLQTSCGTASVYIRVKSKFDDLLAQNDTVNTLENTPVTIQYIQLINNDFVGEGVIEPSSFTIITGPQHGSYTFNESNNNIKYTPFDNYFGYDWMTYQVCDNDTSCDMAQINIWIQEVNTPPVANNDQFVVTSNTKKRFNVLLNDYDIDGTLNWARLDTIPGKGPRKGTIEFDYNTGTVLYLPSINADIDHFTYTICDDEGFCSEAVVSVSVNLGSTILYEQITYEDTPDTFAIAPLLANYNFFFDVVKLNEIVGPEIGTWEIINNNTQIVYIPDHDSIGFDYYNLTLYSSGEDTVDLKVTVKIIPVNDAPVAIDDTVTWDEVNKEITIPFEAILKNDYDVDGDSIFLTENVIEWGDSLHVVFNSDSTITVTADTVFWCDAWFTYEITDSSDASGIGKVHIFPNLEGITVANKDTFSIDENTYKDIDVIANDLFKDNQRCTIDTVEISLGNAPINGNAYSTEENTIIYTPTFHYYGLDSFIYIITDIWGQTDSAWVIINVIQRNTPPVAVNDDVLNDFGSELIISVLANDYDPDSDGFIDSTRTYLNLDEYPQNGTVWYNSDSAVFVYTPTEFTCEGDQFKYTIFDNEGDSATATVYINLPDEAPLFAITDTVKTWPGVAVEFNVLSNDAGYFLPYVESFTNPYSGNIEQTGDSTFMFYPYADFMGKDSMTYQLLSPCENETMAYVLFMIEELKVPEIISPNNDGKNDVLIIDGIQYFPDALLQIYNRYGHIVYQLKAYDNDWGGYSNQGSLGGNKPLPSGTYFYTLTYNEGRNKQAGIIYIFR